jgi:hypothetical protein
MCKLTCSDVRAFEQSLDGPASCELHDADYDRGTCWPAEGGKRYWMSLEQQQNQILLMDGSTWYTWPERRTA